MNKSKLGFFGSIRNSIILNDSQICVFHEDFQQKKLRIQKKKLIKKEKKGKGKRRADLQVLQAIIHNRTNINIQINRN